MSFGWPPLLLALGVVPVLAVVYLRDQRRRRARADALAAEGFVAVRPAGRGRHVPAILFLTAIGLLAFAVARPTATVAVPKRTGTVILAFDVSNSMAATDLAPTRLDAARAAARAFVEERPATIKVGVVAFGEGALVTQTPTDDTGAVLDALDRLTPGGGTATGPALLTALGAITGSPIVLSEEQLAGELDEVQIGYHRSATILLFSDGENTAGADPVELAQLAANAGVRISTVGVGTEAGAVIEVDGFQLSAALDEAVLQQIAEVTGGTYQRAADDAALAEVYDALALEWVREGEPLELTGLIALAAAALLVLGALAALGINGRML